MRNRSVPLGWLLACVLGSACSIGPAGHAAPDPNGPEGGGLISLKSSLDPLITDFNVSSGKIRFVAILSPRCPACVHGAAAIKRVLLDRPEPGAAQLFIVWTPMVMGDDEEAAREAADSLRSPRVHQYYDPGNRVGKLFRAEVFPHALSEMRSSAPGDGLVAACLRAIDPDAPEWDLYMFFDAGARWKSTAPRPSRWIRQAARFGAPGKGLQSLMWRNSYRSPPIKGDLAEELAALAIGGSRSSTPR